MTTDTGMVDKLALLFARHADAFDSSSEPSNEMSKGAYSPREWAAAKLFVHEMFECLRTPTPEMVEAALAPYRGGNTEQFNDIMRDTITGYWQDMIDHALSPSKPLHPPKSTD